MAIQNLLFKGWFNDRTNSRLSAMFNSVRRFSINASGVDVNGTLGVSGTATFSGDTAFSGAMTGARLNALITTDATIDVTAAQSGRTFIASKTSATQTFDLPAATNAGAVYTFKCGHADGEILIDPDGTDDIQCKATNSAGANVVNTDGTGLKNTAASNLLGDYLTIVADGSGKWYTVAQSGIWASQ